MSEREPAVIGQFYPATERELKNTLKELFSGIKKEEKSRAVISPHAGYIYSGKLAALSTSKLVKADTYIVLSPNHTGLGKRIAVSNHSAWKTPLGSIPVNQKISRKIVKKSPAEPDDFAHLREHSIEVQLPFLQHQFKDFKIVAITLSSTELKELIELGNALALIKEDIAVIASSDFSHFVPLNTAKEKDRQALDLIEEIKVREFHELVKRENLSICGNAAITAMLQYCKKTGVKKGTVLKYSSSAEQTGDQSNVVGYASVLFQ